MGVILKSEQKMEGMVEIMEHLQQYVPLKTTEHSYELPDVDGPVTVKLDDFHYVLFGRYHSTRTFMFMK